VFVITFKPEVNTKLPLTADVLVRNNLKWLIPVQYRENLAINDAVEQLVHIIAEESLDHMSKFAQRAHFSPEYLLVCSNFSSEFNNVLTVSTTEKSAANRCEGKESLLLL
jgi:hypothetical protein